MNIAVKIATKIRIAVLLFFLLVGSFPAFALEDSTYAEKARARQYVGGPDESDLKVQTQLVKLQKSKNETTVEEDEGF